MKQGTQYRQLSYEERIQIAILYKRGDSIRSIAQQLRRSPNTIGRELKEKQVRKQYIPKKAQHKTYWRRYRSKQNCMKVAMTKELSALIYEKLPLGWSPERIAGWATRQGYPVSKKAIYRYVKSRCLDRQLFWCRYYKKSGRKRGTILSMDREKRGLVIRPPLDTSGHWELDFIVSRQSSVVVLVMVDRYSRHTLIRRLARKTPALVLQALQSIKQHHSIKTITTDNDIVFATWKDMEAALMVPFYFCRPYHSWEKGLVENTNRWIRCYIPKKTDLATISNDEIHATEVFLNETPRQCLGFRTTTEVYYEDKKITRVS
jgi:transposase, IS30 family